MANSFARWDALRRIRKPLIAAVRGFALGGGCELAMACDMIVAGEDAQFGQPEIKLGIIPGPAAHSGSTRAVGKARAMELILTGRTFGAREAERLGPRHGVVPAEETFEAALDLGERIAAMPPVAVIAAKEAVERADELSLDGRPGVRAPIVLHPVRDRGPEGGHGGVHREAAAGVPRPVTGDSGTVPTGASAEPWSSRSPTGSQRSRPSGRRGPRGVAVRPQNHALIPRASAG